MRPRLIPIVASALLAARPVHAGPPMITDDPDTPGQGHWEINLAVTGARSGGEWELEAPLIDLNYGLLDSVQLKFEMPWLVQTDGHHSHDGAGNAEIGVKWRFLDQESAGLSVSTYPQFAFRGHRGSAARGLASEGWEFVLPVQFQRELGPHDTVFAEVGWAWSEHEDGALAAGIVWEHALTDAFDVLFELHTEGEARWSAQELVANAGFHWTANEHAALIGAVGRSLTHGDGPETTFLGYLAWQLTF